MILRMCLRCRAIYGHYDCPQEGVSHGYCDRECMALDLRRMMLADPECGGLGKAEAGANVLRQVEPRAQGVGADSRVLVRPEPHFDPLRPPLSGTTSGTTGAALLHGRHPTPE